MVKNRYYFAATDVTKNVDIYQYRYFDTALTSMQYEYITYLSTICLAMNTHEFTEFKWLQRITDTQQLAQGANPAYNARC